MTGAFELCSKGIWASDFPYVLRMDKPQRRKPSLGTPRPEAQGNQGGGGARPEFCRGWNVEKPLFYSGFCPPPHHLNYGGEMPPPPYLRGWLGCQGIQIISLGACFVKGVEVDALNLWKVQAR